MCVGVGGREGFRGGAGEVLEVGNEERAEEGLE